MPYISRIVLIFIATLQPNCKAISQWPLVSVGISPELFKIFGNWPFISLQCPIPGFRKDISVVPFVKWSEFRSPLSLGVHLKRFQNSVYHSVPFELTSKKTFYHIFEYCPKVFFCFAWYCFGFLSSFLDSDLILSFPSFSSFFLFFLVQKRLSLLYWQLGISFFPPEVDYFCLCLMEWTEMQWTKLHSLPSLQPNSYVEAQTPNVMVFGDMALRR